MKCPVISYHQNRSTKWWLKYVGLWVAAICTFGFIEFDDIDRWINK